jgi:hypothetical protein
MKKLLLSLMALGTLTLAFAQGKKADDVAKFDSETIDLGKIKQGNPTTATFKVKNISSEDLLIEQANPTCGCTISNYTKEPISAGKYGEINATYNAAAIGSFEKHLTVKFAGTDEVKSITIKGQVFSAEEFDKAKDDPASVPMAAPAKPAPATKVEAVKEVPAIPAAKKKTTAAPAKPKTTTTTAPATKKP